MLKYLIDMDKLGKRPYRKLAVIALAMLVVALVLSFLLPSFFKRYPALLGYGMLSFVIPFGLACVSILYVGLRCTLYSRKHHRELWKKSWSTLLKDRYHASMALRALYNNDPYLKKISVRWNRFGLLCFLVWLIAFLAVATVVITVDALR